jgi:hypothetical protein
VVTPTRRVFPPSVPITTSRMSRMLAGQYSLVVVAFRDENLDKVQNVDEVLDGVKEAIKVQWNENIYTKFSPVYANYSTYFRFAIVLCHE